MKILAIADVESKYLWDYFEKSKLEGIDLIISCGDLDPRYLSFLATFTSAPVLYVHGNHDDKYERIPPEGCICIDDKIYVHEGVRILGLGGSMRYKPGEHQYTEWEMRRRVFKLFPKLVWRRGFDILVTHAPAYLVFAILVLLMLIIMLEGKIFDGMAAKKKAAKEPAAPKAAAKPAAPVQQAAPAPVVEEGIPGDVVAAIMAAIHAMGNGKYTLKAVRRAANGWSKAGVNDTTAPF